MPKHGDIKGRLKNDFQTAFLFFVFCFLFFVFCFLFFVLFLITQIPTTSHVCFNHLF